MGKKSTAAVISSEAIDAEIAKLERMLTAKRKVAAVRAAMQMTQDTYDRRMPVLEADLVRAERELDVLCEEAR